MIETSISGIPDNWIRNNKILVSVLTDWEKEFLSSVYIWCKYKEDRSYKQQRVFEKLQYKSRLDKIPKVLPEEKPKINYENINISHEKSVEIVEFVVSICGKAWDSYTKWQQDFLKDISVQIQKPNAKLTGMQLKTLKDMINTTKKRNTRFDMYIGRILSKQFTKGLIGSNTDVLKITAIKDTRKAAIQCSLVVKFYSQPSYSKIMEDVWVPISQIYSKKRSRLYE